MHEELKSRIEESTNERGEKVRQLVVSFGYKTIANNEEPKIVDDVLVKHIIRKALRFGVDKSLEYRDSGIRLHGKRVMISSLPNDVILMSHETFSDIEQYPGITIKTQKDDII